MTKAASANPKPTTITVSVDEIADDKKGEESVKIIPKSDPLENNLKSDVPINVIARVRP